MSAGGGSGHEGSRGGDDFRRSTRSRGTGWPKLRRAFRLLVSPHRIRDDIDAELRFHIEGRIDDLMARGLSRAEAEREVNARFGSIDVYREETRAIDERTIHEERRMELLDTIGRETRQALRALARSRGFTFIAIITLALGIGATTAVYTLLARVVLNPLPYPHADRLVKVGSLVSGKTVTGEWGVSAAGYFYYLDHNHTFDALGVFARQDLSLVAGGRAERVRAALVTASIGRVLGTHASLGRSISADDDRPGAAPVAVLSHAYWVSRFGGDPAIIGQSIGIEGSPVEVVGVLAADENLPAIGAAPDPDLWFPLGLDPAATPINDHGLRAIGRVRDGTTIEAARADLASLTARFPEELPTAYSPGFMRDYHFTANVTPLRDAVVGDTSRTLWMILGAVALVLVIACANVANLFLVRLEGRRREMAVRTALGADRTHLAWHYLTESVLLTVAAGALGVALSWGAIRLLVTMAPSSIPRLAEIHLGWSSITFAAIISLATGTIFGLIPLRRSGVDVATLRENARGMTASRGRHTVRGTLVVAQVALAVVLLAAAGVMLRSFERLRSVRPGFDATGVIALDISLPFARYSDYRSTSAFYRDLQSRVASLPGVEAVGATRVLPLDGGGACTVLFAKGATAPNKGAAPCIRYDYVTPGYFEAMGIALHGTPSAWNDVDGKHAGVVVSASLANRFWPGEDPVGREINNGSGDAYFRVAAVTGDVRIDDLRTPAPEIIYFPIVPAEGTVLWGSPSSMTLVVRVKSANPLSLVPSIRRTLAAIDPSIPIANARSMSDVVAKSMARLSFTMLLLGVAGVMALVLSAVGLYGVISYIVGERRGEIGVRMALGARAGEVGGMIMLQSVRLAAIGVAIGLLGAVAATRVLRSLLFEVSPTDPLTLVAVAVFLMLLAALASYAPARRAARVDPIEVLRA
ncbi:MAG TPA: ABC transporter permease [Gemmatimonadaceae bacterium]|nr:ABC transporter permease [Gemmatimonadaceae bacterium]